MERGPVQHHRHEITGRVSRRRLLGATGAAAGLGAIGVFAEAARQPTGSTPAPNPTGGPEPVRFCTAGWQTDFTRHTVPLNEISPGGPPRDGIPPIDRPRYVSIAVANAWLEATEPVIALA